MRDKGMKKAEKIYFNTVDGKRVLRNNNRCKRRLIIRINNFDIFICSKQYEY